MEHLIHRVNLFYWRQWLSPSFINPIPISHLPLFLFDYCQALFVKPYFSRRNVKKIMVTCSKVYLKCQIVYSVSVASEIYLNCPSIIKGGRGDYSFFWIAVVAFSSSHGCNKRSIHLTCIIEKFVIIDKNNMIHNKTQDDSHDQSSLMKCQVRSDKPKITESKNQAGKDRQDH